MDTIGFGVKMNARDKITQRDLKKIVIKQDTLLYFEDIRNKKTVPGFRAIKEKKEEKIDGTYCIINKE